MDAQKCVPKRENHRREEMFETVHETCKNLTAGQKVQSCFVEVEKHCHSIAVIRIKAPAKYLKD